MEIIRKETTPVVNLHNAATDELFCAILRLTSLDECYRFFEDICTVRELQDISQRLQIAFSLHEGRNYQEIAAQYGVSTATISRVNRCLLYGSGGYRAAIDERARGEETP